MGELIFTTVMIGKAGLAQPTRAAIRLRPRILAQREERRSLSSAEDRDQRARQESKRGVAIFYLLQEVKRDRGESLAISCRSKVHPRCQRPWPNQRAPLEWKATNCQHRTARCPRL